MTEYEFASRLTLEFVKQDRARVFEAGKLHYHAGCRSQYPLTMDHEPGFLAAIDEAKIGAAEGGVPIGACLVSKEGKILGRGHNMRVQKGSATLHVGDC